MSLIVLVDGRPSLGALTNTSLDVLYPERNAVDTSKIFVVQLLDIARTLIILTEMGFVVGASDRKSPNPGSA